MYQHQLYNKWYFLGSQGFPLLKIPASLRIKLVLTPVICTRHVSLKLHGSSIKINQRGIIQKWNKVELGFLCTALQVIARNMHTNFGMTWKYSDKVMLQIRKSERRRQHHHCHKK